MRARRVGALLTAGLAIATMVAPAPAAAKPGYFVWPGFRKSQFSVKGTHGFGITVSHVGHRVELHASNGDGAAIYLVPAPKPTGDGTVEATFPGVGRVSVRFDPSGRPRRTPPFDPSECNGGGEIKQRGTFSGTIRFRGEEGFTQVAATNAQGFVHHSIKEVCKESDGGGDFNPSGYTLTSYTRSQGRTVFFAASQLTFEDIFKDDTTYSAQTQERRRGMIIARVAVVRASPKTFAVSGPPARPDSASVSPPVPFRGRATFHGTGDGQADWTGTLAVDLPGASDLRLAGPTFSSSLCLNRRCTGDPLLGEDGARV